MSVNRTVFDVREYGTSGNGQTLDSPAIQAAIEACARAGGGTVAIPAGTYHIGALFLQSHVTLAIEAGATLLGSEDPADYPVVTMRWEGRDHATYAPLISGRGLVDVAIAGRGTIDGRGAIWWQRHRDKSLAHPRPRLISLDHSQRIRIQGLTLVNSPSWTIQPVECDNVTVEGVTIVNPPDSPNTDGINPDSSRNVHIANCHIDVGDDCIAIKSGIESAGRASLSRSENVTITNCTMVHGHGGVVIGSEMSGGVRNVVVANCVFQGTDRGIRLKSRRGRGGVVENICVTNVVMHEVLCPLAMNLYYHIGVRGNREVSDKYARPVTDDTPVFRRIQYSHITVDGAGYAAGFLYGLAEMPLEDVTLSDISITMAPDAACGLPDMADDIEPMQRAGFFIRNARRLRMHNVRIAGQTGPALVVADSSEVEISASGTDTPDPETPAIALQNAQGAFVHGCQAPAGAGIWLKVEGEATRAIVLSGNDLSRCARPVENDGAPAQAVSF